MFRIAGSLHKIFENWQYSEYMEQEIPTMKKGDYVIVPRFGSVKLEEVYESEQEAKEAGFTETTHYWNDPVYGIYGKSLDMYHMIFAGFKK